MVVEGQVFADDPDPVPHTRLPYKTVEGGEAFVDWNSLDSDMQQVIEMARRRDDPWQLYESPAGQMRIVISAETESEFRAWKLGNRTGG